MKQNLEILFQNILDIPDRFKLNKEEKELLDKAAQATKPSDMTITSADVDVLRAIDRRSKLTDDDRRNLGRIKDSIYRLKAIKAKKKFVV